MFATTELNKVPLTHLFPLQSLASGGFPWTTIINYLKSLAQAEQVIIDGGALA